MLSPSFPYDLFFLCSQIKVLVHHNAPPFFLVCSRPRVHVLKVQETDFFSLVGLSFPNLFFPFLFRRNFRAFFFFCFVPIRLLLALILFFLSLASSVFVCVIYTYTTHNL